MNAVKTGLCGRAVLLADEEEAEAYRKHVERVLEWWAPDNVEEYALVQSLADMQWRWESIPDLESALYAQARLRGESLPQHPDPTTQRLLLDARAEIAEAKSLKNLRLHERRLRRQYEKDKAELNELRRERFEQEEEQEREEEERRQAEAEQQRRQGQVQKRAERKQAREVAARGENTAEPTFTPSSFEFSTPLTVQYDKRSRN